jgi:hypothetical protein
MASTPDRVAAGPNRAQFSTDRPVSLLSPTRRAADLSDHRGLFTVRLERSSGMPAATRTLESPAVRPERLRVGPTDRPKRGLHRYCSGCARETEHVAWTAEGLGSIPLIRWPTAEPVIGITTCLNCGQWRAASSQPRLSAWSRWPRSRTSTRRLPDAVDSADTADDWASETRAENEGMPPKREPPRTRRRARLRRVHAGRT